MTLRRAVVAYAAWKLLLNPTIKVFVRKMILTREGEARLHDHNVAKMLDKIEARKDDLQPWAYQSLTEAVQTVARSHDLRSQR